MMAYPETIQYHMPTCIDIIILLSYLLLKSALSFTLVSQFFCHLFACRGLHRTATITDQITSYRDSK
jgi:hypothetical protein